MTLGLLTQLGTRPEVRARAFSFVTGRNRELTEALPRGVAGPASIADLLPGRVLGRVHRRVGFPQRPRRREVAHGTNYELPRAWFGPAVVTVHDLTTLRFPHLCHPETLRFPASVRRAVGRGAFVHTVSSFVAGEVVDLLGVPAERVRVARPGVPALPAADAADGRRLAGAERYVLALGTVEPRKDLPTLLAAFDALAPLHADVRLVVAGGDGWGVGAFADALATMRHRDRVTRLGYVDAVQRSALLRGATVLAFPSLYEGFGFPPLEAMAVGTAAVAAAVGGVPEAVGDAATLVAPRDPDALAGAIGALLADDEARADLVTRGSRHVAGGGWSRFGDEIVALYRDVLAATRS